jgi:hypothetical protein
MDNKQKAALYDSYIKEGDNLHRLISKLESEHIFNRPIEIENMINGYKKDIVILNNKINKLLSGV